MTAKFARNGDRPLRPVRSESAESADLESVEEFIAGVGPEVLQCRSMRHALVKAVAVEHPWGWYVELRCTRCESRFKMELNSDGTPAGKRRANYQDPYLFKGHGHMGPKGKGLVRLAWLTTPPSIEKESHPEGPRCPEES